MSAAVGLVCLVLVLVLTDSEVVPVRVTVVGFTLLFAVMVGASFGIYWHRVSRAAALPGTVWAGTAAATTSQLAALGAPVHASGIGELNLAVSGGQAHGTVRVTSDAIVWEAHSNRTVGYGGTTMAIPLRDVRAVQFSQRRIRAMLTLNMRVVAELGVVDFALTWNTRTVRQALRRVGLANVIQG